MMNEMSYRDKMIILIMSVVIILVAGFFALVRPKYNTLVADRATYNSTLEEWEGIDAKIAQIPVLQDGITKEYKEAKSIADMFVNEIFAPVNDTFDNQKANLVLEQYMQTLVDESELQVTLAEISGVTSADLEYYYYTPDVLTYSLLESADINGNYAAQVTDLLKNSNYLKEREVAEVMINTLEMEVIGKKENLMAFLTKMQEEKNAVRITALDIDDYTFGEGQTVTVTEQHTDEDGNVTTTTREVPAAADGEGTSSMTISMTFYNAKPIDEPVLGD